MSSSFSFPRPTTTTDDLEDLYKAYGVDRAIVLDLAVATETPENIPESVLEILAELGLSFTQILPNFLRHHIAFLVRSRVEGLSFSLGEFRHLVLVKQNTQSPGTFLVSPRPGRHVIEDVSYRDEKWRKQFVVFRVDRASVGDFDFSRLPRNWAENIAPSGSSLMSDEIRGLIGVLRRGRLNWSLFDQARIRVAFAMPEGTNRGPQVGCPEDGAEHSREVVATPSVQAQSSDLLRPPLVLVRDSEDEDASLEERSLILLSLGWEDETVAVTRKRCRSSRAALPGSSRPTLVPEGDGSLFAAQGDLISLAGRMRSAGCRLPSLASLVEKEAYAKVTEAFNEYVVVMEDRVEASQNDKDVESIGSKIKRLSEELEATKREGKRDAGKIEALTDD
ncbi:hypothetical protein F2Q69_00023735 [Brassica cretica]|uniref:Uncharacterized protein n=1 Tax=Brassica cretica TaxID=69181 RepID=A0A8S9Q3R8_BRACR|nr:hypothetical protein F2Q69_00023735 [Brassica cretica]